SLKKWFPYNKGGHFRKRYGNNTYVVNWENNGAAIKEAVVNNQSDPNTTHWSRRIFNTEYFFKKTVTWSDIGSGSLSATLKSGFISDGVGVGVYNIRSTVQLFSILGLLNSKVTDIYFKIICPTLHFNSGAMGLLPIIFPLYNQIMNTLPLCVQLANKDWDLLETSWDFNTFSILLNF
ncbi:MAG: class I SAM-dependent DNA methyltransferase, partial [bacterium]